jgi:D-hexose-6-phosphate mutarotase
MSAASEFAAGRPLRGGVPLCFPWFGPHPADPSAPAHGFARLADWQLTAAREEGEDVVLLFRLSDSAETRSSAWPHRFEATYTVTVGARLGLALQVRNLDTGPVTVAEAFHTYLAVPDIHAVEITGFEGVEFIDRLAGPEQQAAEPDPVTVSGETDRIYLGTSADSRVSDGFGRTVTISTEGSASRVLWNPWIAKAAAMPDFGNAEWTGMLCVETANVGSDAIVLAPRESHTMSAVITPTI